LDSGLEGKVVLVTGAGGGIGSVVARDLSSTGVHLILSDINQFTLSAIAKELAGSLDVSCDITQPDAVCAMAAQAVMHRGRVDALVHCAGLDSPRGRAWELGTAHWLRIIDVDLNGAWWCVSALLPHMLARKAGRIVLISSVAARIPTITTSVAYNAAKTGIHGLVTALSNQVEAAGVRVNAIAPGPTGTGAAMTRDELAAYRTVYPLGEGGPEPVAHAVRYLLGPGGDWVSGSILNVSGGRWRG
jgi:NAD(P)-dependent dehydrogenase (short-subunit alcohol dehydrogenase family)